MKKAHWGKNILELIRRTSTDLPTDVEQALKRMIRTEKKGSLAAWSLRTMLENVALARKENLPICQDTGTLLFYFRVPVGFDTNMLSAITRNAVSQATRLGYLRHNTLDSLSGLSYETNVAHGSPVFYFEQGARKNVEVRLLMKGGGCENTGMQYSLPDGDINAGRDLDGVRKCVLHAVWKAQGRGCSPSVLGVCIGGDRSSGYQCSKEQFLRRLTDRSPMRDLARLEKRIKFDANELRIGPMGLGGKNTVMSVKIGSLSRLPASFFVSVSFMCWAYRRRGMFLGPEGGIERWLY